MWKLNFYLLPSNNYHEIGEDEAREFGEKVDYLNKNENLYIPYEFYDIVDKNNMKAMDFLYGVEQNDISDYFLEIISKQKMCSKNYDLISKKNEYGYLPITKSDITKDIEHICIWNIQDLEAERYFKVNDVVNVKRYYIKKSEDFEIYEDRVSACYPNLYFHDEAFRFATKMGKCIDVADELTRHLTVLNDIGKKLYEYNKKNEKKTLSELKSGYDVECSGKGSNEEESYNKEIIFNNKKYLLTCNPHTKLYRKRTNQRIYFCWGRDEIENHNIIIVRIGDHWQ